MTEHVIVSRTINLGNYNSRRIEYKHEFSPMACNPVTAFREAQAELDKMVQIAQEEPR